MKYHDLVQTITAPYFSRTDLVMAGLPIFDYQLSLWVKKGYLIRLKNGIYAFARERKNIEGPEVASLLYQPSYLSLEYALSWYGFIPEMVFAYTSITSRIPRTFENPFGRFIYRHVKSELFWGYLEKKTEYGHYLLAEPEKALLDYIYLNLARINTREDFEQIRLNWQEMADAIDPAKFLAYLQAFGGKKMFRWAKQCLL